MVNMIFISAESFSGSAPISIWACSSPVRFLSSWKPFPVSIDRNGDGVVNDQDLLFQVAIRSDVPTRPLIIPNADNNYFAGFVQDDWRVHPQLTLNLGLRYEIDPTSTTSGTTARSTRSCCRFYHGNRHKDANNWGPRIGFNWARKDGQFSVHGGYGIYYDRVTLEIESLERGLDGRALPIDVH